MDSVHNLLNPLFAFFFFMFGCTLGSFFNVVALRLPYGESVVTKRSACPHCGTPIKPLYLFPLFGYFFTLGRCWKCKTKISPRYPAVEFFTGLGTALIVAHFFTGQDFYYLLTEGNVTGDDAANLYRMVGALWLFYTAIPLALIDLEHMILPDVIVKPGIVISLILGAFHPDIGWQNALLGCLVGGGGFWFVAKAYLLLRKREGLGFGDVKYLAMLGALVGWQGVIWVIMISSFSGAIFGITYGLATQKGLKAKIPFGPFLGFATVIVYLFGAEIEAFLYGTQSVTH